jgi:hypothetical protein
MAVVTSCEVHLNRGKWFELYCHVSAVEPSLVTRVLSFLCARELQSIHYSSFCTPVSRFQDPLSLPQIESTAFRIHIADIQ